MGIGPITHLAIEAWCRLYRVEIGPWETSIIDMLDGHYRQIQSEKSSGKSKGETIQDAAQAQSELNAARAAQAKRRAEKAAAEKGAA